MNEVPKERITFYSYVINGVVTGVSLPLISPDSITAIPRENNACNGHAECVSVISDA